MRIVVLGYCVGAGGENGSVALYPHGGGGGDEVVLFHCDSVLVTEVGVVHFGGLLGGIGVFDSDVRPWGIMEIGELGCWSRA